MRLASRAQFNEDSDASDSDDDGDEFKELSDKQKRRLQRAMMPLSAIVEGDTSCSSSSEGEEELMEEEEEMGDDGDDGHEVVPKVNAYAEQFRCHLCPEKLLLSHGDLEKHEASKAHLNRLHRQQQQEEGGKEPGPGDAGDDEKAPYKAVSSTTAADSKAPHAEDAASSPDKISRKMKRKLKMKERRVANKKRTLNEGEIAVKKAKFQAKKDRRQQKKANAANDTQ
mmetsp:Transcript_14127/g.13938  ORF Transcript_14127/g.13938 Transcript_14127/m.13938 type:complete len:226 (+) Transcript_14127:3-680(+)